MKERIPIIEQKEFKGMMNDYVDEISDPKHKPEMKVYLKQMEARENGTRNP